MFVTIWSARSGAARSKQNGAVHHPQINTVWLWDAATVKRHQELRRPYSEVMGAAFSFLVRRRYAAQRRGNWKRPMTYPWRGYGVLARHAKKNRNRGSDTDIKADGRFHNAGGQCEDLCRGWLYREGAATILAGVRSEPNRLRRC